jgi:hypothetical protein
MILVLEADRVAQYTLVQEHRLLLRGFGPLLGRSCRLLLLDVVIGLFTCEIECGHSHLGRCGRCIYISTEAPVGVPAPRLLDIEGRLQAGERRGMRRQANPSLDNIAQGTLWVVAQLTVPGIVIIAKMANSDRAMKPTACVTICDIAVAFNAQVIPRKGVIERSCTVDLPELAGISM